MNDPLLQSVFDKIAILTWPAVGALFIILILKPFVPTIIDWIKEKKALAKDKVAQMQSVAATSFEGRLSVAEFNASQGLALAEKIKSNHLHDVEDEFKEVHRKLERMDEKLDSMNGRLFVVETRQNERKNI